MPQDKALETAEAPVPEKDAVPDKEAEKTPVQEEIMAVPPETQGEGRVLVAYFSATGNTKTIAEYISEITNGELYEIIPAQPYTADDLKYYTDCRADKEQKDPNCRPEIENILQQTEQYDVVFIGYPIWHSQAPKILYTFLESHDFSGKKLIPFCTSGSSPVGSSAENMIPSASGAEWLKGVRFSSNAGKDEIEKWINGMDLNLKQEEGKVRTMKITIGSNVLEAELAENSSAEAFAELLTEGPVTVEMEDYSNFEKVGDLPKSLPRNDEQITTEPGDIILYLGKSITIYYDANSWNFTRLGKIKNITGDELKSILGSGSITATFSID